MHARFGDEGGDVPACRVVAPRANTPSFRSGAPPESTHAAHRAARTVRRPVGFMLAGLVRALAFALTLGLSGAATVQAQEDFDADVAPPAAAPQPPAAAPAAAADSSTAAPPSSSRLVWLWRSLGWFYSLVFLSLSFTLVALVVMNLLTARRENVVPIALVEEFETQLNDKRYQDAYELAKNDESILGRVLSAGLAQLKRGYEPAVEAMQEVGEEENMKLEHRLSYMALIGTVSPMFGLLGTVQGMVASFSVIAQSATTPKPSELAAGISTALMTTLVGLFIAIPAIGAYSILRNRVARLMLETGIVSEGLMSRFSELGKRP